MQPVRQEMKILRRILLGMLVFGIVELYLFIKVSSHIGALATVLLIVATAVWGGWLISRCGFACTHQTHAILRDRQLPPLVLMESSFLVLAGVLLIIPGFITDIIGIVGSITPLRRFLLQRFLEINLRTNPAYSNVSEYPHTILEGEYKRVDE